MTTATRTDRGDGRRARNVHSKGGHGTRQPGAPHRIKRNVSTENRRQVLAADRCHYCADILLPREVEHRIPLVRGGDNHIGNLVASCVSCNSQKKTLLVSEWRAYRQANGMPWPPMASHSTEAVHYAEMCDRCEDIAVFAHPNIDVPDHMWIVNPFSMHPDTKNGVAYFCQYRCPANHRWTSWWGVDEGYFSDCPCLFCTTMRDDWGDRHQKPMPRYEDLSWAGDVVPAHVFAATDN